MGLARKPVVQPPARRYVPPREVTPVSGASLGFTNGFLLAHPMLYAAGDLSLLSEPAVAIVGSRKASDAGRLRAAQLARALVRDGVTVMSGLAAGIDTAALASAIENGGRALAVIGTPIDKAYPRENAPLQEEIYSKHLLISPFAIGTRTFPSHFPERNRVMARLARATVVIEAGDTSGTLHQVIESLAARHPVFISRSVMRDRDVTWPARFAGDPLVFELENSSDVLDALLR